jgi:hypothetical protein
MVSEERLTRIRILIEAGCLKDVDDDFALDNYASGLSLERAIPLFEHGLGIAKNDANRLGFLTRLAAAHRDLGDFIQSLGYSEQAFSAAPTHKEVRLDRAYALLLQRQYEEGWSEFDLRLDLPGYARQFPHRRLWNGQTGQRVFVSMEQGIGDQIQMVRFLEREPLARNTLIVECHAPLVPIFKRLRHIARIVPCTDPMAPSPLTEEEFDYHIPFMSLAGRFNTPYAPSLFPTRYLRYDLRKNHWHQRFGGEKLRVGLVWRGNPEQRRDRFRSIDFRLLAPLFSLRNVQYYSLVKDHRGREELRLGAEIHRGNLIDLADELTDMDQTAAVVANLDRVISVDTSVAHLAGAIGAEVWMPLSKSCEWRWGRDGELTHWYPSMLLLRQQHLDDWEPVIAEIHKRLLRLAG